MGKYLKMADVFDYKVAGKDIAGIARGGLNNSLDLAAHAINSHDELVADVDRLRRQLACAFMAGWEEGINGMECDEAEVASVELAEQFARN